MIFFYILLRASFHRPKKIILIWLWLQNQPFSLNKSKNQHLVEILSLLSNHIVFHFTEKKHVKDKICS
jgi:hypothetical protein